MFYFCILIDEERKLSKSNSHLSLALKAATTLLTQAEIKNCRISGVKPY